MGRFRWERLVVLVVVVMLVAAAAGLAWKVHTDHQAALDRGLCRLLQPPSGQSALNGPGTDRGSEDAIESKASRTGTHLGSILRASANWSATGQLQLSSEDSDYIRQRCYEIHVAI